MHETYILKIVLKKKSIYLEVSYGSTENVSSSFYLKNDIILLLSLANWYVSTHCED